jgi:hypothetical protein
MRKLSIFIWGSFFLFLTTSVAGQLNTDDLNTAFSTCQDYLVSAGLENVQIQLAPNQTIWIAYENRRYRNEVTALGIVLNYAVSCFSSAWQFVIVPKYQNMPLKYLHVDRDRLNQFLHNEVTPVEFMAHLKISFQPTSESPLAGYRSSNVNSSLFKFDLALSPGWKAQFARPHDPAQLQFNFLADFSLTAAPGMQVKGQLIVPFYNEFQRQEGQSRLGQVHINQFVRLPHRTFLTLSAGMFEYDCYGISMQIKRFLWRDRLSFSARLDYLQTHSLNRWLPINSLYGNTFSYLFQADYRFEPIDFLARITWGRYLLGDVGWRVDVLRKFHELELGFMGVWNESLEFLIGMTVRIPIPVSKQPPPGRLRICTPKFISWDYRYLPCFDGFILNTGEGFEEIADQLTPCFIRANINQLKTAIRYVKLNEPSSNKKLLAERGK